MSVVRNHISRAGSVLYSSSKWPLKHAKHVGAGLDAVHMSSACGGYRKNGTGPVSLKLDCSSEPSNLGRGVCSMLVSLTWLGTMQAVGAGFDRRRHHEISKHRVE